MTLINVNLCLCFVMFLVTKSTFVNYFISNCDIKTVIKVILIKLRLSLRYLAEIEECIAESPVSC